ncbi:hypothetical protein E9232_005415 [Inquilinus ginsengisoli]|uniref:Uncharacterized protein n=1 Tax=Inquilinus ginsengisoli TaxID=363840 RepID=A0ABU1JW71_9PROT|nr:hypothetical protein [Inquilinus ginsengisoli]MDR6292870.1 hypothetical protein [Inquilinus ginsengisoli]
MSDDYAYNLAQCDVPVERRPALESYRARRRIWLSWIDTDEHHAIWNTLHSMIWAEVSLKFLSNFASLNDENPLNNYVMVDLILGGYVARQTLAIRRLMEQTQKDRISIRRLVSEIKRNFSLFTRENYVCFDGLPYDYEAVRHARLLNYTKGQSQAGVWVPTAGPEADGSSESAHVQFDRLAGIDPASRSREDCLPLSLITTIEKWLEDSGADDLAKWSDAYLAHSGGPESRRKTPDLKITADKFTKAIKGLVRVTEAISACLLFAGGRSGSLMPVAQFDLFEKLDKPIVEPGANDAAYELWHKLSDTWDICADGVDVELIGNEKAK